MGICSRSLLRVSENDDSVSSVCLHFSNVPTLRQKIVFMHSFDRFFLYSNGLKINSTLSWWYKYSPQSRKIEKEADLKSRIRHFGRKSGRIFQSLRYRYASIDLVRAEGFSMANAYFLDPFVPGFPPNRWHGALSKPFVRSFCRGEPSSRGNCGSDFYSAARSFSPAV